MRFSKTFIKKIGNRIPFCSAAGQGLWNTQWDKIQFVKYTIRRTNYRNGDMTDSEEDLL